MERRLVVLMGILASLGAACLAFTAVWWFFEQEVSIPGAIYGATLLLLAALVPQFAKAPEEGPACRSCHRPVRDDSFGFCLRCGVREPLRGRAAH